MFALDAILVIIFIIWLRRSVLMLGSIKRYSCIPTILNPASSQAPKVSIIIPCRNEAHNLHTVMPSLMRQDYPNLEFIALDDRSTDHTLQILCDYQKNDPRLKIIEGRPLPVGWTGKNNAMAQCAEAATGDWLLFTDADTEHDPHSVLSSVTYALKRNLDLLTLSARCVCKSFGEHLVQPLGIGSFSVWFKIADVNNPGSQTPLACGQYFLIRKDVYQRVGGSERVKNDVTEDLALFKVVKGSGYRSELAIGTHLFATRMYRSLAESWVGWRRIYLHALQKNIPSILAKMGMLLFNSTLPFAVAPYAIWKVLTGHQTFILTMILSLVLCIFILFLRSRSHKALGADQWSILLHPASAITITGILLDGLIHHFRGMKVSWKMEKY